MPVHRAEQRAGSGGPERLFPGHQGSYRAGGRVAAVWDADLPPVAFLVGFRAAEDHSRALAAERDVGNVEPDKLRPAESSGEPEEQKSAIPITERIFRQRIDHAAEVGDH